MFGFRFFCCCLGLRRVFGFRVGVYGFFVVYGFRVKGCRVRVWGFRV